MAKASRSSKKQPDFDPSEIEDLIFSPAVGKGVGSHLVRPSVPLSHVLTPDVATVVSSDVSTVATQAVAVSSPASEQQLTDVPTVVSPVFESTTRPTDLLSTVDRPASTTVASSVGNLWVTENGDLVSEARVKRIRLAQDVINSAEESVYDTLWNAKLVGSDEVSRLVQAGYDYLVKRTRLSRKTIQRIVAKLLEKDFIEVDTRADIYQRTATIYRVFSYKAVLDRNIKKGRLHVAKMGPGFSYVRQLQGPDSSRDMTTVDTYRPPTVVGGDMASVVKQTTVTVVKNDRPTVVKMSPYLLDAKTLDRTSSVSDVVRQALSAYGAVDDDVVNQLMAACESYSADCTEEEVAHFIREKGKHVQRRDSSIKNPLGFLLTAVPKCFSGLPIEEYRAAQRREVDTALNMTTVNSTGVAATEDPALLRWRKEQEAALADPKVSEQEKHLIRLCLGLNVSKQGN